MRIHRQSRRALLSLRWWRGSSVGSCAARRRAHRRRATPDAWSFLAPGRMLGLRRPGPVGRPSPYLCATKPALASMEARLAPYWRPAVSWRMAPC